MRTEATAIGSHADFACALPPSAMAERYFGLLLTRLRDRLRPRAEDGWSQAQKWRVTTIAGRRRRREHVPQMSTRQNKRSETMRLRALALIAAASVLALAVAAIASCGNGAKKATGGDRSPAASG